MLSKSPNAVPTPKDIENARAAQAGSLAAFAQDFEIWSNKRACINPLVVPADGAFAKVRMWYRQFYNDRSKAADFQARASGVHTIKGFPSSNPRAA
jgi:3-ketosteroid 9alpha-monooxygenase subunit A